MAGLRKIAAIVATGPNLTPNLPVVSMFCPKLWFTGSSTHLYWWGLSLSTISFLLLVHTFPFQCFYSFLLLPKGKGSLKKFGNFPLGRCLDF